MRLAATDALGYYGANPTSFTINGGTMTVAAGIHCSVLNSGVTLNAGTITSEGAGDSQGNYIFDGNITTLANANPSVISPQTIALRGNGSGGTITFNVAHGTAVPDLLVSAAMTQSIPIIKTGAGLMEVTGTNSYSTTTISNGTLQVGGGGNSGTLGTGNITNNATLIFARSDSGLTISTVISGSGGIVQNGSGTTILSATNTFTGPTVVNQGILELNNAGNGSNDGIYASSLVTVNSGAQILVNQTNALDGFGSTAGSLAINAGGLVTTSNLVTCHIRGPLVLSGGTLASGTPNGTYGSWTLDYPVTANGATTSTLSASQMNWGGTQTFTVSNSGGTLYVPGSFAYPGGTSQAVNFVGPGTMILAGSNTYTGTTTINSGTLQIAGYSTASGATTIYAGGTLQLAGSGVLNGGSYSAAISNSGALVVSTSGNQTLSGAISGPGSLTMNGNSILTLGTASNTFSGGTTISAGTLTITAGGSNTASALGVGQSVTIGSGAELRLAVSDALGYYGANPTSFTINGGVMTVAAGIHCSVLNSGVTLSAGTITSEGAGDADSNYIFDGNITTLANANPSVISPQSIYLRGNGSGGTITFNVAHGTAVPDLLVSAAMTQSIPIIKTGAGLMEVTGTNSYSTTTISNGTLQVGNGGNSGTLGTGNITNNATLVFARSDSGLSVAGAISGSGGVFQNGSGTTTISALPSYTGDTTVNAGKISFANASTWAMGGNININGGMFDLTGGTSQVYMAAGKAVSFGPAGGGTLSLNSVNFYQSSGTMSIATSGGAQSQIIAGATSGNYGINANGNAVSFNLTRGSDPVADLNVAAPVWNNGSVILNGNGILELTAANSYSGVTTINGGTLQVGGGRSTGSLGTGTVTNNGALVFNRNDAALNVASAIGGSGGVFQNGSGTTTLSGNNGYTGTTNINLGTLAVTGTLASSTVNVNAGGLYVNGTSLSSGTINVASGATLGGTGSAGQALLASGGIINTSANGTNTLTLASLNFSGNGTVNLPSLSSTASLDILAANLAVGGGTGSVALDFPYTVISNGVYRLVGYSGGSIGGTGFSAFTVAQAPALGARQQGTLLNNSGEIDYSIVGTTPYWNGQQSDWLATNAWTLQPSGAQTTFIPGDNDVFDDTASSGTVAISQGNVAPISVLFNNNTLAYTLSGAYGVTDGTAGSTFLIKSGTGSLTIGTSNSYSGGTTLNAGLLNINNPSALGSGTLTIAGGTLGNTSGSLVTLTTNNPQNWNSNIVFSGFNDLNLGTGAVSLSVSPTVTVTSNNLTVGGAIGGTGLSLTKAGAGNLILTGANTYNAGTFVSAGTLTAGADSALNNGLTTLNPSSGTAVLAFTSASPTVPAIASSGAGSSLIVLGNTAASSSTLLTVGGNNASTTFSGTIGDLSASNSAAVGGLVKTVTGTLTLSKANTYSGGTTVSAGILAAADVGSTSAGSLPPGYPVTVNTGATLQMNVADALGWYGGNPSVINVNGGIVTSNGGAFHDTMPAFNLTAGTITAVGTGDGSNYYFDGTITTNSSSSESLIATSGAVGLRNNNNTNGNNSSVTFNVARGSGPVDLLVSSVLANSSGGANGLIKTGNGIMVVSGASTFTGNVVVSSGTLQDSNSNGGTGTTGGLGNATTAGRTVTINNGGTLVFGVGNALAGGTTTPALALVINAGGQVVSPATLGSNNVLGNVTLNGGTLTTGNGTTNVIWMSYDLGGSVIVGGTSGSTIAAGGTSYNAICLGINQSAGYQANFNVGLTGSGGTASSSPDLTVSAPLYNSDSNGNATGLIKSGAGLMDLTVANAYTGPTTVSGGTLLLGNGANTANDYFDSNGISIAGGATFQINQTAGLVRYSSVSKTISGAGTFSKTGSALTYLANDSGPTISTFNLSAGGLINVQAGTLASIKTATTNLGSLTIATGALATLDNNATQGANGYFDALSGGGTLQYDGGTATRSIALGTNSDNGSFAGTIANGGTGPVALIKTGTGTQVLSGASTYTGGTTVGSGILQLGNSAALGTGALAANGGTLDMAGYSVSVPSFSGASGIVTNSGGTLATLTVSQANNTTFSGAINDSASQIALFKSGTGMLTLASGNAYSGGTTIAGGTLQLGNAAALGSGPLAANGGKFDLAGYGASVPSFSGAAGIVTNSGGALATLTVSQSGNTAFNGTLTDGASQLALYKTGVGMLTLGGSNNFSGGTTIANGTLQLGNSAALGNSPLAANGGTLDLAGYGATVPSFSGAAGIVTNSSTATSILTVNQATSTSFNGSFIDGAGPVGLNMAAGVLTLGNTNAYSGPTTIAGGVLSAGTTVTLSPSSAVSITGGTLDASGYAQMIPSLIVGSLGALNLAATNSALQVSGSVQLGGTLNVIGDTGAEILMTFNSNPGSTQFSASTGIAPGFTLSYTSTDMAIVSAGPPSWINTSGGSWNTVGNWLGGTVAGTAAGQQAVVTVSAGAAVTITLDTPQTLGVLTLGDSTSTLTAYTLAPGVSGSGSLTMANTGTSPALITVTGGSQMISANVVLAGSLTIAPTAGSTLTISGNMSENTSGAGSLLLNDAGTLVLSGSNGFTGGTVVANGTLILTNNEALAVGSSLTIGDASEFANGSGDANTGAVSSGLSAPLVSAPSITPVPEPGTLVLLAAGTVLLAAYRRRRRR